MLSDVPFGAVSQYLSILAGDYQIRVTIAGTTTVAIDTGAVTVPEGGVFTALDAVGGGAPFTVQLIQDR
ncbi:DUF4397 domain-containing protein [bacterium]|nr:DUF4397 domain-containing protein [bacterium]